MKALPLSDAIEEHRRRMGSDLVVVGHHYQEDDVIRHTDFQGDSLELSRRVSETGAPHIMFCGVYFMAESAALLAGEGQRVYLPEPSAECSMALMSPAPLLEAVMESLSGSGRKIVPLTYVNSTLAVKAFTGKHGGAVCTSANARTMLEWALEQGDAVLFLPDKNLGNNAADGIGLTQQDRHILNIRDNGRRIDLARADRARLLLWPGFCSIHTRFVLKQMERARAEHPGATIMVHPECIPEVVAAADLAGSTSAIIRLAENIPDGSTLYIGTEINLVQRLADRHEGRVTILPLVESACTHMAQTTEESLAKALASLSEFMKDGTPSPFRVHVPDSVRAPAGEALKRMLSICR